MIKQSVLILATKQIDIDEPSELICNDFPLIYSCTDVKTARELLEKHTPSFLIFNHDSLQESFNFQQKLLHNKKTVTDALFTSILLCKATDVNAAYKLCQKKIFDDYILFKPLYDPYRLNQTLQSLSDALSLDTSHKELEDKLVGFGKKAKDLHRKMEQSIDASNEARIQAQSAYASLKTTVIKQVHAIPAQLASHEWQEAVKVLAPEVLQQRFGELTEQRISKQFQNADDSLQHTMEQWVDSVKSDMACGVEFLEEVEATSDADADTDTDVDVGAGAGAEAEAEAANKKILVVEDDEIYSSILQSILEEVGYHVFCEPDGTKGLNRMALVQPDHVLLDYELPDMTGLDFLKKVNNSNMLRHIPVLMLTGHNDRELVKKSIMGGAKGYILKPANREVILSKLQGDSSSTQANKD